MVLWASLTTELLLIPYTSDCHFSRISDVPNCTEIAKCISFKRGTPSAQPCTPHIVWSPFSLDSPGYVLCGSSPAPSWGYSSMPAVHNAFLMPSSAAGSKVLKEQTPKHKQSLYEVKKVQPSAGFSANELLARSRAHRDPRATSKYIST